MQGYSFRKITKTLKKASFCTFNNSKFKMTDNKKIPYKNKKNYSRGRYNCRNDYIINLNWL